MRKQSMQLYYEPRRRSAPLTPPRKMPPRLHELGRRPTQRSPQHHHRMAAREREPRAPLNRQLQLRHPHHRHPPERMPTTTIRFWRVCANAKAVGTTEQSIPAATTALTNLRFERGTPPHRTRVVLSSSGCGPIGPHHGTKTNWRGSCTNGKAKARGAEAAVSRPARPGLRAMLSLPNPPP